MNVENTEAYSDALAGIDQMLGEEPDEEEQDDGSFEEDGEAPEGDGEPVEDEEEGEEEPEAPTVDAPHSWSKEDKELFASLDPAAQAVIARREKERDDFVNAKAREAANTRSTVETEARDVIGKMYANHEQQLRAYAAMLAPQAPDERLLYTGSQDDVNTYHRQAAAYHRGLDQQQALHQEIAQAQAAQQNAMEQSQRAAMAADAQRLRDELPEWFNSETGPALQRDLQAIGAELGYTPELMNEASSSDILALKKAMGWKQDAEKYRELMGKKMETVRAAKGLPKMTRPGSKPSNRQINAVKSQKAWDRVKANPKDGNAIADWLGIE